LIQRYPTATPMMLSGLAPTTDVEYVAFAPFAFDPLPADVPFASRSYPDQVAGIIESFAASSLRCLALSIHHMPQIRQYQPEFLIA